MTVCGWFALCSRPAVGVVAHPVLGDVPICQPCADKLDLVPDLYLFAGVED